jgi:hypothetical protein
MRNKIAPTIALAAIGVSTFFTIVVPVLMGFLIYLLWEDEL